MAASIRESIIVALAAKVATITTANGYDINVKTVDRARRVFVDTELPAAGIFDGLEIATGKYNFDAETMRVTVEMHSDAATENRSIHANKMIACLKKAVLSGDTTYSSIAERTMISETSINYPQDDDITTVAVSVTFSIMYEEVTGNPYSNP
jgi:hypothetical protein